MLYGSSTQHVLLISYDLKRPGQHYAPLYDVLKSASTWWHYLESTWLLATDESLEVWQQKIKSVVDENDSFLLIELTSGTQRSGWLPQEAWDWIKKTLG